MNLFRLSVAVAAGWLGTAAVATAQPQTPLTPARPTFSPYLNLLRNDASPAVNYYGIVRPEQRFLQSQVALSQQIRQTNQAINEADQTIKGADPNKPPTGHAAVFNNTMGYFGGGGGRGGSSTNLQRPAVLGGQTPQVFGGNRPQVFSGGGGGGLGYRR
jgi:hypothetical protein